MIAGELAHRAGGQALAAYLHGVRIDELRLTGITLWVPPGTAQRMELLAELAVGLTGVVASSSYSYGWDDSLASIVTWSFSRRQLEDLNQAQALVDKLAPCSDEDVFFEVWSQARETISVPLYWQTVERLAAIVVCNPLTGAEVLDVLQNGLGLPDGAWHTPPRFSFLTGIR